jgi:cob(I)alamin adenosyltransferase
LFDLGADLATPCGSKHEDKISRVTEKNVTDLERSIDAIEACNEPIKTFVMPGGTEAASRIHVARCTCRRAERAIVRLAHRDSVNGHTIEFVNRLSDLLFAASRLANREAGVPDVPWIPQNS